MAKLTYQQKLDALAYRFYQGATWKPKADDFYTTSRPDLELYQVVSVEGGVVRTRYTEGSDAISEWPEGEFLTDGFGPKRVFVPEWVICAKAAASPHTDDLAVDRWAIAMKAKLAKKRAEGRGGWDDPEQCSAADLSYLLIQHCFKGDPLDVSNLAMMLQQRGERIVIDNDTASMARAALKTSGKD
ncbi:MAG: hypothetical protein J0H80_16635 [Rhizobiales bacterium]|nr:hypothetical protein [Hyphomicrobiales bacterium]